MTENKKIKLWVKLEELIAILSLITLSFIIYYPSKKNPAIDWFLIPFLSICVIVNLAVALEVRKVA
jgi:hypothetical protein